MRDNAMGLVPLETTDDKPLLGTPLIDENGDGTGSPLYIVPGSDDVNIFAEVAGGQPNTENEPKKETPASIVGDLLVGIGNVLNNPQLPIIKTKEQIEAERQAAELAAKRKRSAFIIITVLAITLLAFVAFKNK